MAGTGRRDFLEGLRDGLPIGLGYLAVAFSLGIAAREAGLTAVQGFVASLLSIASAGEYAGFTFIAAQASYAEIALGTLITNARYLLMSTALSQRFSDETPLAQRIGVGLGVTDELFGLAIARPLVRPIYQYGAMLSSIPLWCIGTSAGIVAGQLLPARVVTALSARRPHRPRGARLRAGKLCRKLCGKPPHPIHDGLVKRHPHHRADRHHLCRGGAGEAHRPRGG